MIPVHIEPKEYADRLGVYELCCFCYRPTNWWTQSGDIACCTPCAWRHEESELPTRAEWFRQSKARRVSANSVSEE